MLTMQPSQWLYDFLKRFEQFRPTAYKPTPRDVWTIGYGHTKSVVPGDVCTLAEAQTFLQEDVSWAAAAVNRMVVVPLTQNQYDPLVSLVFNIGAPDFITSTLLRKLDAKDYAGAADQFLVWDKQGGQTLDGLESRREAEQARFLTL